MKCLFGLHDWMIYEMPGVDFDRGFLVKCWRCEKRRATVTQQDMLQWIELRNSRAQFEREKQARIRQQQRELENADWTKRYSSPPSQLASRDLQVPEHLRPGFPLLPPRR
ncbi:MAG: hypothetical protein ACLP00_27110 [Terracidiphilus sp.]